MEGIRQWLEKDRVGDKPFTSIICGPRGSGKSVVAKDLFTNVLKDKFDMVVVFSETLNRMSTESYYELVPHFGGVLFDRFDDDVLRKIGKFQDTFFRKNNFYLKILLICDDCGKQRFSDGLEDIFIRGRHSFISAIYLCQNATQLTPSIWNQSELSVIFRQMNERSNEFLTKNILGEHLKGKKSDKLSFMMNIEKHNALVIDSIGGFPIFSRYKAIMS